MIKKIILFAITSPLLVIMILFDIIKFPVLILLMYPIFLFLDFTVWLKGKDDIYASWDLLKDGLFMGVSMWKELVFD
jgi:hypothetical protein